MTGARNSQNSQKATPAASDDSLHKIIEELRNDVKLRFDAQEARFLELKTLLTGVQTENQALKKALEEKEREIGSLKIKTNDNEQYARAWSIRILDLNIPADQDSSNTDVVMQHVYNRVLLPILEGAVKNKLLKDVPLYHQILETAHILPAKPDQTPPIIARFFSRNIKTMMFRLKKEFALRQQAPRSDFPPLPQPGGKSRPAKLLYPFYEDLTTVNFRKMRAIAQDSRVISCWSVAGQLRFRLNGEDKIRKVTNIFTPLETIIGAA